MRRSKRSCTLLVLGLVAAGPAAAWDRFEIIHWQRMDQTGAARFHAMGGTAVAVMANRDGTGTPLAEQTAGPRAVGLRWYIENTATDFYSSYHRYTAGREVNWRFLEARTRYRANMNDDAALRREPSLKDPAWRDRIQGRLLRIVTDQKRFYPLFYSLGDEPGIADLSAYWDFDQSDASIAGFRRWLRHQYGSLAALNAQWGTSYRAWDAVRSETTRVAMRRPDDNFSAWNDFKAWMDTSFADALRMGTDAVHRADPTALSAIEGGQMPGWGGYDYGKLVSAVDVMELYDMGENMPIVQSLNPRLITLVTVSPRPPVDIPGIWREVLRGAKGIILWDEDNWLVMDHDTPAADTTVFAPLLAVLTGTAGRRMMHAEPVYDDITILYSPVSFRLRWMLDHRADGDAWIDRSAEIENEDNAWRTAMRDYAAALHRLGLRPRFITPDRLEQGLKGTGLLILPECLALSGKERQSIRDFARNGGRVIANTPAGRFDGHGRKWASGAMDVQIVPPSELPAAVRERPRFPVLSPDGSVEPYLFRSQGRFLLALRQRDPRAVTVTASVGLQGWPAKDLVTDQPVSPGGIVQVDPVTPAFLEIGTGPTN